MKHFPSFINFVRSSTLNESISIALGLGIVTGCCTRPGTAARYSRVRVRVGFIQPWPYPYPQPGVGGLVAGRHIQTPRKKPVNGQPKRRQTHHLGGMFSSFLFTFFFKLTHSLYS